jgi:hypothetical protein
MPYIKPVHRIALDPYIDALRDRLRTGGNCPGDLNYVISRLVGAQWIDEPRYKTIAKVVGVLTNVTQEFYRRIAGPYEDKAIEKNGDINEYIEE